MRYLYKNKQKSTKMIFFVFFWDSRVSSSSFACHANAFTFYFLDTYIYVSKKIYIFHLSTL